MKINNIIYITTGIKSSYSCFCSKQRYINLGMVIALSIKVKILCQNTFPYMICPPIPQRLPILITVRSCNGFSSVIYRKKDTDLIILLSDHNLTEVNNKSYNFFIYSMI